MKVLLSKGWFAPDGTLYDKGVHDFSADWEDQFPTSAKIVPAEKPAPKPEVKK